MAKIYKFLLSAIFCIGLLFRIILLGDYPAGLNWDEVSHGYTAYSILITGKDQWSQSYPIFNFRAYGDYPTTLNTYLTIPLVKFFGLKDWVTRLPTAILGSSMILSSYFIAFYFLKSHPSSLFVSLLVALSPWTFFTSRGVYQSTVGQAVFMLGLAIFFRQKHKYSLGLGLLFIALSVFGYHSNRIVSVLVALFLLYKYKEKIFQQQLISKILIIFSIIIISLSSLNILTPESRARSAWVGLLNESSVNYINEERRLSTQPEPVKRLLYNKATYLIPRMLGNLLNIHNPVPLFLTGSRQYQYNLPNFGLIYPSLLPFFYYGFLLIIFTNKLKNKSECLTLWSFALIPSLITTGDYPTLRLTTLIPLPFIAIAYGMQYLSKLIKYLVYLFTLLFVIYYYYQYFVNYSYSYSSSWQFGYKQAVETIKPLYSKYDKIIFTKKYGEPHEFVLYYWPWDPAVYQKDLKKVTDYHANWWWVDGFDKFLFINDWEMVDYLEKHKEENILIITSPNNFPKDINYSHIQTINFLDNQPAFEILTNEI